MQLLLALQSLVFVSVGNMLAPSKGLKCGNDPPTPTGVCTSRLSWSTITSIRLPSPSCTSVEATNDTCKQT
jgi:hypothetical protein